jgi:ubiquinone biosynthesis protein
VDEFARALRAVGEPIFGMDATRISMGRLLSYLFEVTERFGMETRTELILLQRTMVVVEGVARSLDPKMNIWNVAKPIVEDYIKTSIGPRAFAKDLGKTALVLARFGPRLPGLMEQALIAQAQGKPEAKKSGIKTAMIWGALGAVIGGGLVAIVEAIL